MRLMLVVLWLLCLASRVQGDAIALRAARALTGDGQLIAPATLLIENERIVAITSEAPPPGYVVVDYGDATLIPGLVAAASLIGAERANDESSEVTPTFHVSGDLDPNAPSVREALRQGITTACVRPGFSNVIGGLSAVVRPGAIGDAFVLRDRDELLLVLGPWPARGNGAPNWAGADEVRVRRPTTRMGTVWLARKSFADARQFATRGGDASGLSKEAPGRYQPGELEVLASALAGRIPVRIIGHGDKDVHAALRLIEEFALPRVRLEGLLEGYRAPAAISALDALIIDVIPSNPLDASQPVAKPLALLELQAWLDGSHPSGCPCCGLLLNASADDSADDPRVIRAAYGLRADNVAIVAARNPRCAISTHGEVPRLLEAAAWAVRHGLAPSVALELVTRRPAEMLGLGDELGILAVGRRADVVVLSGDPFEITSHVLAVYSSGKLVCLTRDEVRR